MKALELTDAFAEAIAIASCLSAADQNFIAYRIMEEIEEEKKWADSFARSQNMLNKMAAEALQEYRGGKTRPLEELSSAGATGVSNMASRPVA